MTILRITKVLGFAALTAVAYVTGVASGTQGVSSAARPASR